MNKPKHPFRQFRDIHHLSQGEFGLMLETTGQLIAQVEGGYSPIPNRVFYNFVQRFDLDPVQLEEDIKKYQIEFREMLIADTTNKI